MKFSACIEWLFADESEDFAGRIYHAREAGMDAVEFWKWTQKDIGAIERALAETGLALSCFVAEPMIALTNPENREAFLEGLKASAEIAQRLGAPVLIAQAGDDLAPIPRETQRAALVETLGRAGEVLQGTGVRLGLEPLNTRIDHVGYFLPSTAEGLDIAEATGRDEIGIVYDVYHSAVMGEDTAEAIGNRIDRVLHVHVADHPGRQQPGTGTIDLSTRVQWLRAAGYKNPIGLEYRPDGTTLNSLQQTRAALSL